ncbi:MAG: GAF domain-containing protein [Candidatus Rokubacteria bacterium]|nr:GAF domain-containing protein [Candidatus Rokubacteria bacterium]
MISRKPGVRMVKAWLGRVRSVQRLLNTFAAQAAMAIENARLYEEAERRRQEAEVLADVTRTINASLDLGTVLQRVTEAARELCASDAARIGLLEPGSDTLVFRHRAGARYEGYDTFRVEPGKGVSGLVLVTGRPFRTDNYAEDPRITKDYLWLAREEGVVALMAVPIRIGDRVEGLVIVHNRAPRPFSDQDEAILLRLADHAAIAIQNAGLYAETQQRLRHTETLLAASQAISSTQDLTEILRRMTREIVRTLGADTGGAWLVTQTRDGLLPVAGYRVPKELVETFAHTPFPLEHPIIDAAKQFREPIYATDSQADPRFDHPLARLVPHKSALGIPMWFKDRIFGGVAIAWVRERHRFTPEEVRLAEGIARQAALAIENARLLETERELEQRQKTIAAMGRDLASEINMHRLLPMITEQARQLMGSHAALLLLLEGDELVFRSAVGVDDELKAIGRLKVNQSLTGRVIREGSPLICPDLAEDADWRETPVVRRFGYRAMLAVPMRLKDRTLGVLKLLHREPRPFRPEDAELLGALAAQAALAIENAQLYEETRQRLGQTETLLAVGQAVGSTLDLSEIARRTIREMVRVLGADMGGAWCLSPNRDCFVPLAGYRVPKELVATFARAPLSLGDGFVEIARQLEGPIYSSESQTDARFDHPLAQLIPHKSVLVHPMWLKGELIGGFAVVWVREPHSFTSEEIRLVEGIARQAAIAVDNARLLEAEREARERLAVSETRYRELFENILDIAYVHDLEGKILAVNEAGVRATGRAREELLGMDIAQVVAPQDLTRNRDLVRRMIRGERVPELFTTELIQKDGSRVALECSGRLVFRDGKPVAVQGIARDVTVRRKLETRQAAFVEIVKELATEDDFERLFSLIGRRICELLGTDSSATLLLEGDELVLRGAYGLEDALRARPPRKVSESRVGRVVLTKKPHVSSDMTRDPHWRDSVIVTEFGYRAVLEVPVILRGQVIGILGVLNKSPRPFSAEDVGLLVSLASHAAIAFERTNLLKELKTRLRETQTLLAITQEVTSTLDLTERMRRVAREAARALGADMVGAFLADPEEKYLHPIAGYHVPKQLLGPFMTFPIPIKGHRLLEEAWEHHRPVYSSDAEADPRVDPETLRRFPQRSVLFCPMIVKGQPVGGLFVTWWEAEHHFTPEELDLVEAIGRQVGIAIENARLFQEAEHQLQEMTGLHRIAQSMSTLTDIRETYGRLTRQVAELVGARRSLIALYDRRQRRIVGQMPGYGVSEDLVRDIQAPELAEAARQVGNLRKLGSLILNNPRDLPARVQEFIDRHQLESIAAVPLSVEGEVIGILYAADKPGGFTDRDARLLEVSASQAAVMIRNAHLYQQVNEAYESLKATQAQLVQAEKLAATGQLAAGVAHEINNPLSVILGFSSLALEKQPSKELGDDLETIRTQALRAAKIIRDLLVFARPRPHERVPVDVNEALRQTLSLQAYHLSTDQIEVVWNLAEPLPKTLADRGQLQQVILNLVLNAHHAMKATHGRGTLWIETGSNRTHVWAKVRDDGPGIAPELLPRIFDPFLTTKPVGQGTGLGLSISYGILQAHGGQLLAESEAGRGATFTIMLPAIESEVKPPTEAPEPAAESTRQLSVLVVDDEPTVARLLSLMFEQIGHRAEVAHSGRDAMTMLARGTYDLMTLDLRMPHMSGQEVWKALQTLNLPRRPSVLFVTGDIAKEVRTFLQESGQPYLEKPFQPAELRERLKDLRL